MKVTVATANLAGVAREEKAHPEKFKRLGPVLDGVDLVGLQEVVQVYDAAGDIIRDDLAALQQQGGLSGYQSFFFPHLDSTQQSHYKKWRIVFPEYYEQGYRIQQGSAVLVRKEHPLRDLLLDDRPGSVTGQVVPWTSAFYGGNRDTEPRSLLLARVRLENRRFVLFACTHLTALTEENKHGKRAPTEWAKHIRKRQMAWIVEYIQTYRAERRKTCQERHEPYQEEPLLLVGDFNALPEELEQSRLSELNLEEIEPTEGPSFTHRKHQIRIDLIYASQSITGNAARVIDLSALETVADRRISDHHPVIAEFEV